MSTSRSCTIQHDLPTYCIIKLGGSAVTIKDRLETAKPEEIHNIYKLVSRFQNNLNQRCILVHGAGSYGHFQAKQYGVSCGYHGNLDDESKQQFKAGFCKTRVAVTEVLMSLAKYLKVRNTAVKTTFAWTQFTLNHIIVKQLVCQGINAIGMSPCGKWTTDNGQVVESDTDSIGHLLKEGYLPVLHGDCVLDQSKGCTILSGDTIIEVLCTVFKPKWVLFLADVNGIFSQPPTHPDAQLLPVITVKQDGDLPVPIATTSHKHDVTGGILKKLRTAVSIVTRSGGTTSVFICRINSPACYSVCEHGSLRGLLGTEIRLTEDT